MHVPAPPPSPHLFFETINAYQKTAASKAAIEVEFGTTPEGDAYTFSEYNRMLTDAGFGHAEMHPLPPTAQSARIATA